MESVNIKTIYSYDTEFSADSVEWCPHKPNQNIFVCANYQVVENTTGECTTKRFGRLLLFSIHYENGLNLLQTIDSPAILDQKWCHIKINDSAMLGVVDANKSVVLYKLNDLTYELELVTTCKVDSDLPETLVLSLDWSTGILSCDKIEIVCSDSKGNIHLLKLDDNTLTLKNSWHGHDYEAWITGFYYWDTNIIFSGGDDLLFLKFDQRVGSQPIFKNKSHEAGVTSLHSNSVQEHLVATGSYDEHVRLWDVRRMKSELEIIKMPGTLWRLKWDPFEHNKLLAACMLGGVHIINMDKQNKMEIVANYYEHKNIAYGADWCYLNKEECNKFENVGDHLIGTCSFYDHLLCIAKTDLKNK